MLEKFQLLGEQVYYPAHIRKNFNNVPTKRDGFDTPKVKDDERWFFLHMPSLIFTINKAGDLMPVPESVSTTFENLRFDSQGHITHVHPKLAFYFVRMVMNDGDKARIGASRVLNNTGVYTGPKSYTFAGAAPSPHQVLAAITKKARIGTCQSTVCTAIDPVCNPRTVEITGKLLCGECMARVFRDTRGWFSIEQMKLWFDDSILRQTLYCFEKKPVRYILIGYMYSACLKQTITLSAALNLGMALQNDPVDKICERMIEIGMTRMTMRSTMFDPDTWRYLYKASADFKIQKPYQAFANSDIFNYNGWIPLPANMNSATVHQAFGKPIYDFTSKLGVNSRRTPYVALAFSPQKNIHLYYMMKTSMYHVMNALLNGTTKLELRLCTTKFTPIVKHVDPLLMLPSTLTDFDNDIIVSKGHYITWGCLRKIMSGAGGRRIVLYGSLWSSVEGCGEHTGVFANILLTFKFLAERTPSSAPKNVTIAEPGPEARSLSFKETIEERHEVEFLSGQAEPVYGSDFSRHEAWSSKFPFVALLKLTGYKPLRDTRMSWIWTKSLVTYSKTDPAYRDSNASSKRLRLSLEREERSTLKPTPGKTLILKTSAPPEEAGEMMMRAPPREMMMPAPEGQASAAPSTTF